MKYGGVVYTLTNQHHTVYYIGVTSDLLSRVIQHQQKHYPKSFTARYNIDKLIYFEVFGSITEAIVREKQIKKYSRKKKLALVAKVNHQLNDLFEEIKDW